MSAAQEEKSNPKPTMATNWAFMKMTQPKGWKDFFIGQALKGAFYYAAFKGGQKATEVTRNAYKRRKK